MEQELAFKSAIELTRLIGSKEVFLRGTNGVVFPQDFGV